MKVKKTSFRNDKEKIARILRMADGFVSVATLLFLFSALTLIKEEDASLDFSFCIVYSLLAVSYALQAFAEYHTDRLTFIKKICFAVLHAAAAITVVVMDVCMASVIILVEVFLLIILTNRVTAAITDRRLRVKLFNIVMSLLLAGLILTTPFQNDVETMDYLMILDMMLCCKVLGHIIAVSFSQMRFGVLRKILRKTFAAEILFGLILLILSFSFVFHEFESGMETYFDALWYCFAVVTTIGFGDTVVTSPVSRVLSVILGIYGIVVVAMITSVIVNFYIEVKDEKSDDEPDEPDPSALPDEKDGTDAADSSGD